MQLIKQVLTVLLFVCFLVPIFSQNSPPDLNSDIAWDENAVTAGNQQTYANKTAIENAFNNARRKEETQKSLTANALGTLSLPSNFTSLTEDIQAFMLLNFERTCRAGVSYSGTIASGLPLEAIENTIDGVSQAHMDWLIANNVWSHTGASGLSPFQRIDNAIGISCRQFISYGENISLFGSSSGIPPLLVAQSMYLYIYADAGNAWGHRRACLYQGFNNNRNSAASEGYFGWASGGRSNGTYNPLGWGLAYQYATVMNFFDPVATGCSFVVPIELLVFDAKGAQNGIELSWTTVSEINLDGFDIERSEDGTHFSTLDFVAAQAKSKSEKTAYSFLDPSVKPHLVYFYRLRMVDNDGASKYSPLRSAILRGDKSGLENYRISSNLSNGTFSVENLAYDAHEWTIQLFDISGKLILAKKVSMEAGTKQDLPLPANLLSGLYLVRMADAQSSKTEKIVFAN